MLKDSFGSQNNTDYGFKKIVIILMMPLVMVVGARDSQTQSVLNDSVGRKLPKRTVQSTDRQSHLRQRGFATILRKSEYLVQVEILL